MTDTVVSIKDQAAYLRANNFWIGRTCSENFVKNLYDLASRNVITAEQWNTYGNAARSWDKQSRTILAIAKISDPAKAADTEEKAAVLKINGFWIDGNAVGEGVIDNLYSLHASGKINPDEWNKLGIATLPWDKQSDSITSRLDVPAETPEETAPAAVEEETPPQPAEAIEDEPAADDATVEGTLPNTGTGTIASYEYLLPPLKDEEPQPPSTPTEESVPDTVPDAETAPAVTEPGAAPIPAESDPTPPPAEETPAEEPASEEVSEKDQPVNEDVAGVDEIRNQVGELDAAKMTEQELRDALTNDPVLRMALRQLAEQGLAKNSEELLKLLNEIEGMPAATEKQAPAPAEQAPPTTAADVNTAEAPKTTAGVEELSAEEKIDIGQKIAELEARRTRVSRMTMGGTPPEEKLELIGTAYPYPRNIKELKAVRQQILNDIDDQIKKLKEEQ